MQSYKILLWLIFFNYPSESSFNDDFDINEDEVYDMDLSNEIYQDLTHSLIRGVLIQSCSAGAKNFTKCVFYHVQFSGAIQNIAYHRAIKTKF